MNDSGDFILPDNQGIVYANYNPSRSITLTWLYSQYKGQDNTELRDLQLRSSFYFNIFEVVELSNIHLTASGLV